MKQKISTKEPLPETKSKVGRTVSDRAPMQRKREKRKERKTPKSENPLDASGELKNISKAYSLRVWNMKEKERKSWVERKKERNWKEWRKENREGRSEWGKRRRKGWNGNHEKYQRQREIEREDIESQTQTQ